MTSLRTSETVKQRVKKTLECLLDNVTPFGYSGQPLFVQWLEHSQSAKLMVNTDLKTLAQYLAEKKIENIRHDLCLLRDWMGILDDLRLKKRGSSTWFFMLNLWHKEPRLNMIEFENTWDQIKAGEQPSFQKSVFDHACFLQVLIDAIPLPIFYKDANRLYRGCNQKFEQYLGRSRHQILARPVDGVALPAQAQIYEQKDIEILQGHPKERVQIYSAPVDGAEERRKVRFYKGTFSNLTDDSVAGLIGVILDITDLEQKEQTLLARIQRFQRLAEATGESIVIHNNEKIEEVNDTFSSMFGYERDEIIGNYLPNLITVSEWPVLQMHIRNHSEGNCQVRCRRRDGAVFPCSVSAWGAGRPRDMPQVMMIRDLSFESS